jgi:glycosyltransferase involved in cell wall biosynthesis/SAM-dependent methyltransferase
MISTNNRFCYTGADNLEVMALARNYNAFLLRLMAQNIGDARKIIDFGAGTGTFAVAFNRAGNELVGVEPDAGQRRYLDERGIVSMPDIAAIPDGWADAIYTLNVLEHIEDDRAALSALRAKLRPGGKLFIYVPAFPLLYSAMDRKVGHFRRYRRNDLQEKLRAAGFENRHARHVDSLGFFASLVYKWRGDDTGNIAPGALKLYDRLIFPVSRLFDALTFGSFGKNIWATAVRPCGVELGNRDTPPNVAILLCTCHGQKHLAEQLESIAAQTYPHWEVWASDDCSRDDTFAILEAYKTQWPGRFSIQVGPNEGFAANFLSLTCNPGIDADYCAYSDQDDIWEADKLERAVAWLSTVPSDVPALYCSRTQLVDADNCGIGFSPLFAKPPHFANALVQNIGGGNTMMFNRAARALLLKVGVDIAVVSHDWWAYMVVSGCGGRVFYDGHATVRYRQHEGNLVGTNITWQDQVTRIFQLWQGRFTRWNDINVEALTRLRDNLTPENRQAFEYFATARKRSLIPRLIGLKRSGIHRQTFAGNLGLIFAAILKKM